MKKALVFKKGLNDSGQESRFQVAASNLIFYASIQRADEAMLLSHYSQSKESGEEAPTREILYKKHPTIFDFYLAEFDRIWAEAVPIEEILEDKGIFVDRSRVLNHLDNIRSIYSRVAPENIKKSLETPCNKMMGLPFPKMLVIMPNMDCSIHCDNCFTWNAKPYGQSMMNKTQMTVKLFESLVDQAIENGVSCIELSGGGEPLEHPEIDKFLAKLAEAQDAGIRVGVLSNGNQLIKDPGLIPAILKLDYIRLSYTEHLESQGDDKAKEFRNLLQALGNRKQKAALLKPRLGVKILLTRDNAEPKSENAEPIIVCDSLMPLLQLRTEGDIDYTVNHIKIKSIRGMNGVEPLQDQILKVEHAISTIPMSRERMEDVQVDIKQVEVKQNFKCWINPIMSVIDASGKVYLCCNFYESPDDTRIATFGQDGVNHFRDFWGRKVHITLIDKIPVNKVCNSHLGCHCRLVHYQELVEPYAKRSTPDPSLMKELFDGHSDIL